jgi:aminoglycoside 6'-N-acetyltransferase
MIIYKADEITVRELEQDDKKLLLSWLTDSRLLEFYEGRDRAHDIDMINDSFYIEDDEVRSIFEYNDKPIGYIQFYPVDESSRIEFGYIELTEKIFGVDQFIGETSYWNKGIGKLLMKSMIEYLVNHKGADKIIMNPQIWNERAISCYGKCGFKRVKLLKEYEKHEGQLRDCWLMEYSTK